MCQCTSEIWAPIPGFEDCYAVSTCGRARSLDRIVPHGRGAAHRAIRERKLRIITNKDGYQYVNLYQNGRPRHRLIHHLVLETFIGPRPPETEGCHWDRDPANNHVSNLRWGTKSENNSDKIRHGTHHHTRKTHCPLNHSLIAPNLVASKTTNQWRDCLACNRARSSERHAREIDQPFDFQADANARYARIMAGTEAISAADRTRCPLNHLLTAPNLVVSKLRRGHRQCLACNRAHANQQHAHKHGRPFNFKAAATVHYAKIMGADHTTVTNPGVAVKSVAVLQNW